MRERFRVATYSRVSTAHHDQHPEIQVNELRRYCEARGWEIIEEVVDHGFSGSTDQRPGFKRLMSLVRSRKVDGVVCLKLDRLFRSLKHLVNTLDEIQAAGCQFTAVLDHVDYTTPSGRLFVGVLACLAEFEKSLLVERTLLGLAHARAHGKRLGRPQKHDPTAILALRVQGRSYRAISRELGVPLGCISRAVQSERKSPLKTDQVKPGKSKAYEEGQ